MGTPTECEVGAAEPAIGSAIHGRCLARRTDARLPRRAGVASFSCGPRFPYMQVVDVTLSSTTVERSVPLWPDLSAYSSDELKQALHVLRQLLKTRCAQGSIISINGFARACGLSAFVRADVLDQAIAHPLPLLTKRLLLSGADRSRRSPFLDEIEIARGNARDGLHLLIMQANVDATAGHVDILFGQLTRAFYRLYDGYRLARVVADYVGQISVGVARGGEFEVICEFPRIAPGIDIPSALVTLTPERAAARGNTTIQTFAYHPPCIFFTPREQ